MSSWGNNDNAANAPFWAVNSTITKSAAAAPVSAPTAANVAVLYANTTQDSYITGETIGLFAVDAQEEAVAESTFHPTHTGWVLKTTGTGGRAGRVQHEVLVALANVIGDGDAQVYPNVAITLSRTASRTVYANTANSNTAVFTVTPTLTGNTAAALTYQWQVNNNTGGVWVNMTNGVNGQPGGTGAAGVTTPTLTVTPWNTTANNYVFRAIVTAADEGVTATSANSTITVL
jgi:hypothetical protein